MTKETPFENNRILVIDDNPDIHKDFRGILVPTDNPEDFTAMERELFGNEARRRVALEFIVDSAFQGQEGLEMVKAAVAGGEPYGVAFVDMRMPPGWDGLETIHHLWQADPNLEIAICTAYSDYSWERIFQHTKAWVNKLLILKKPFDAIEVQQLAMALAKKWQLGQHSAHLHRELEALVEKRTADLGKSEESARQAENRWRSILDNAPNYIVAVNRQGEVEFINHPIAEKETTGLGDQDLFAFIDRQHQPLIFDSIEKVFERGEAPSCTVEGVKKEKKETWYDVHFGTIKEGGEIVSATLIATDVSQRREIEAQLLQSQKLEAIGRLAGGVAHDVNNILGVILAAASVLEMEIDPDDEKAQDVQRILSACHKGGRTTRDLLGFARKGKYLTEIISVNLAIHRVVDLLKHTISKKITVQMELDQQLQPIEADPSQIDNALLNLCVNAIDAMGAEGVLTIRTKNFVAEPAPGEGAIPLQPGSYVNIQLEDTGSGMNEETLTRAFEPFYTTKAMGEGTGLGLSMVYGVVKNHGGVIELQSTLGKGTIVELFLPSTEQIATGAPPTQTPRMPSLIPERGGILVVDDEDLLLKMTARILKKMGYKVFAASGGKEAIEQYSANRHQIDGVLLDMMMPELDGYETFIELKKINPEIRIVLCSGYSKDKAVEELIERGALGFLHKPFDVTVLTRELDSIWKHHDK